MFNTARIKLTAWYLLIIMLVSMLFSVVIYTGIDRDLQRFERMQEFRIFQNDDTTIIPLQLRRTIRMVDPDLVAEARSHLIVTLVLINISILVFSGLAGYFLAGRTLRPIQKMVDEQNRFISDASHELRTPLTSLRSEIEVNLRNKRMTLAEAKKLLESNLEEVVSLQTLSDSLLELAQSKKIIDPTDFVAVSVQTCVDAAIKKLNGVVQKKSIMIEKHVPDLFVSGIPDRITELFVILLDNAMKYSPGKSTITVSAEKQDDTVMIKIADQGIGIEEAELPYIFDRFYRANKSRSKEKISGYGLGLAIAKKIVEDHKGEISVKSTIDQGTTFTIQLLQSK